MSQQCSTSEQIKGADGATEILLSSMEVLVPEKRLAGREPLDTDGADERITLRVDPEDIPVNPTHVQQEVLDRHEIRVTDVTHVGCIEVEQFMLEQGVEPAQLPLADLADARLRRAAPRSGVGPSARREGQLGGEEEKRVGRGGVEVDRLLLDGDAGHQGTGGVLEAWVGAGDGTTKREVIGRGGGLDVVH